MNPMRRRFAVSSGIALGLVACAILFATKGSGCGRTDLDRDPNNAGRLPPPPDTGAVVPEQPYQPRDLDEAFIFAAIGDYGYDNSNATRVARLIASWQPDFVITTGDNNYPSGSASTIDDNIGKKYAHFIGDYKGRYGPGSPTNRFWPSPGNHDWYSAELQPYLDYFTLPGNERYYDVQRGLVHLFALDSDVQEPDGTTSDSRQATWLKERLASSRACFKVVYFHHPAYSSGSFHEDSHHMRWPFAAWGADAVLTGHEHVYERLEVDGIPFLTVGLGGASIYGFAALASGSRFRFSADYGALRVSVDRRGMTFEFVDARGRTVDTFVRQKDCDRQSAPAP